MIILKWSVLLYTCHDSSSRLNPLRARVPLSIVFIQCHYCHWNRNKLNKGESFLVNVILAPENHHQDKEAPGINFGLGK
jgi:hypothetical protein